MAKEIETINIPKVIVEGYDTESIVAFLTEKFKKYNSGNNRSEELAIYISILSALNDKINHGGPVKIIS